MEWYYAQDGQQMGPINESKFETLVRIGAINRDTLVWHDGMADWKKYGEISPPPSATPAPQPPPPMAVVAGMHNCAECGRTFAAEEMVQYGSAWVCATCKPLFFQRLKEGAPIRGELIYGKFWTRFAAKFLDGIIIQSVNMFIQFGFIGAIFRSNSESSPRLVLMFILQYGVAIAYTTFFLGKYGATVGKMATGLKVVTPDGQPITYTRAFSRYWGEMLSGIILGIGYLMAAFDDEKRTLHDRICGTRVVLKTSVPA